VGRYRFEPYGKATFSGSVTSDFQYASGYYDSAAKLVKFGTRYYDPALGRWTQQDALAGSLGSPKTLNRYAYAGCDPVNSSDPSGQFTYSIEYLVSAVVAAAVGAVIFVGCSVLFDAEGVGLQSVVLSA
jgi:RHS repeat-associated protein